MRTGTDLVKFALEENFTNVRVLVNIGRWKHASADTPFTWHGENWEAESRHLDVSTRITAEELRAVRAAVEEGTIRFAISVRNIYTWLVSYVRFDHWHDDPPLRDLCDLEDKEIIAAVQQWNVLYRSYLELFSNEPERYLRAGIDGQSRSQLFESAPFDRKGNHPDTLLSELHGSVLDLVRDTVDEHVVRAYGI